MKTILNLLLVLSHVSAVLSQIPNSCGDGDPNAPNCCITEILELDLSNGEVNGDLTAFGAAVVLNQSVSSNACGQQVILKVTFDPPVGNEMTCKPTCTRRLLNINMNLDNQSGYTFNIGNSPSNDGTKNDMGDHGFDANLVAVNGDITAWSNENCVTANIYQKAATQKSVTVRLSSLFYEIVQEDKSGYESCGNQCFFNINDQTSDTQINANNDLDIYASFNRVILPSSPNTGTGVCNATLTWECCT